jgi:hypothetical protein
MKIILSVLMLFCLCGCDSESDDDFIYREYQLPGEAMGGVYLNLGLGIESDKAVLINDEAEFQRVFFNYPNARAVDFKKYTLLLVKSFPPSGVRDIEKTISKTDDKYVFTFNVARNGHAILDPWYLAYIIPKTSEENIILSVTYGHYTWY